MWMTFFVRTSHSKRASIMASKFFMLIAKRLAQDRRQSFLLLRTWLGWKLVWNSEKNKRCWLGRNISLWSQKLGWWRRIKKCNSFICLHSKKLFTRSKEWSLAPRKLVQFWKTPESGNFPFLGPELTSLAKSVHFRENCLIGQSLQEFCHRATSDFFQNPPIQIEFILES